MKSLTALFLIFLINQYLVQAQNQQEATNSFISQLIDKVNNLPKTNIAGQGAFSFQSKYSMYWNRRENKLIVTDERYKSNSDEKLPDKYIAEITFSSLHKYRKISQKNHNGYA